MEFKPGSTVAHEYNVRQCCRCYLAVNLVSVRENRIVMIGNSDLVKGLVCILLNNCLQKVSST